MGPINLGKFYDALPYVFAMAAIGGIAALAGAGWLLWWVISHLRWAA